MSKKIAFSSVMTALCLVISYIEFLFPINIAVPGIKPGFSNIVIVLLICTLGFQYAFPVLILKILLTSLLFSGVSGMIFSLTGGLLSFLIMYLLYRTKIFSPIGISAAGGVFHNTGQLLAAAFLTGSSKVFYYFPILLISGLVTGTIIGFLTIIILKRVKHFGKLF